MGKERTTLPRNTDDAWEGASIGVSVDVESHPKVSRSHVEQKEVGTNY